MLGVVPEIATSILRLWVAAGSAALLVIVCALAFGWTRTKSVARTSIIALGAILGGTMAWAFLDAATTRDHNAERLALETRAAELNARALAPGSALACLDALAGETVEVACEKALFANPAAVASATSYAAARLTLLADMAAYNQRGGADIDGALLPLRHSLEADRFGFVARALAARDGCSSQSCNAFSLLRDPSRVRANLSGGTLDRYLEHYTTVWSQSSDSPVADSTGSQPAASNAGGGPGPHKLVNIDFPTSASIPPISIMNPEPKGPAPGATAAADPNAHAAPAARSRKQAGNAPPQAVPAPPVDPVWNPGATLAAPQGPAPPPAALAGAPVQLNPAASQPEASAGGAARTQ
jgi:hypothetical protein